jgi:hypothetical protein
MKERYGRRPTNERRGASGNRPPHHHPPLILIHVSSGTHVESLSCHEIILQQKYNVRNLVGFAYPADVRGVCKTLPRAFQMFAVTLRERAYALKIGISVDLVRRVIDS